MPMDTSTDSARVVSTGSISVLRDFAAGVGTVAGLMSAKPAPVTYTEAQLQEQLATKYRAGQAQAKKAAGVKSAQQVAGLNAEFAEEKAALGLTIFKLETELAAKNEAMMLMGENHATQLDLSVSMR